jgi:hypothetical protein
LELVWRGSPTCVFAGAEVASPTAIVACSALFEDFLREGNRLV